MSSSESFFREKYNALPRPERWMPGPPSPWSNILPTERSLIISELQKYIYRENDKEFRLNEISRNELSEVELENLGDNDIATKPAAVLVPLITNVAGDEIDSIILMTRTMTVSHHKGQVSFPGGMVEVSDEDVVQAALRETQEETGISPESFEIMGTRSPTHTRSRNGIITPVLATCDVSVVSQFDPSSGEVDTLHVVPVAGLLAPDSYVSELWDFPTMSATIHMYFVRDTNGLPVFIWGATAHILTDVLHCLNSGTFH